jgi:metal transporter CNNM
MNAGAMEALPIFLNELLQGYLAIIMSLTLVLLFGEIGAVFVHSAESNQYHRFLITFFAITYVHYPSYFYPIGKMLDYCFGEHTKSR